jgi:CheY-like chemotaxis protein
VPTILVADDNSNIQKMVSLVFKEKGIRVVAVGNGEAACRKVPEVHPDVVLADVFMPVRNGYEVCEFVKQDPQFAETPVILLVGAFDPLDEKEAQRVGANGVLKKPFVPPEPLVALVSSLLKLEPPVEEPPPVVEAPPVAPPVAEMPAPRAAEAPRAAVSNDDYDAADEIAPTFGDPVATPATRASAAEEAEDDSEPASEWARRRATMDYEIDSAESANLVEKLAAGKAIEEPEILASNKHLPFGGANLPEMTVEAAPQSSHASWSDSMIPEVAAEQVAEAPREDAVVEESSSANNSPMELEAAGIGEFSPPTPLKEEEAPSPEAELAAYGGSILESAERSGEAIQEAPSEAWSSPQIHQPAEAAEAAFDQPDEAPVEARANWHDAAKQVVEPPLTLPAMSSPSFEVSENAATHSNAVEVPSSEPAPQETLDQATLDDVVAKVISKLEPQLHQALANGVLRPLVEEVLNQQRRNKK